MSAFQPGDDPDARWGSFNLELLSILHALETLQALIKGVQRVHVLTDHANIVFLLRQTTPRLIRWAITLRSQYPNVTYGIIKGKDNPVSDTLSRGVNSTVADCGLYCSRSKFVGLGSRTGL